MRDEKDLMKDFPISDHGKRKRMGFFIHSFILSVSLYLIQQSINLRFFQKCNRYWYCLVSDPFLSFSFSFNVPFIFLSAQYCVCVILLFFYLKKRR